MGGVFGVVSKESCVMDLFFGIDYHSHLGTRRGGMAVYGPDVYKRQLLQVLPYLKYRHQTFQLPTTLYCRCPSPQNTGQLCILSVPLIEYPQ